MNDAAKKRLIGAVVLVLLMVIFVPMLFEEPTRQDVTDTEPAMAERDRPMEIFPPASVADPDDQSLGADELLPLDAIESEGEASAALTLPSEDLEEAEQRADPSPPPTSPSQAVDSRPSQGDRAAQTAPTSAPPATQNRSSTVGASGRYLVQVAALSTAERAAGLEAELRQKGFSAYTERAIVGGKTYFRVRVGPEPDRARAGQLADAVEQATGYQGQVLTQP